MIFFLTNWQRIQIWKIFWRGCRGVGWGCKCFFLQWIQIWKNKLWRKGRGVMIFGTNWQRIQIWKKIGGGWGKGRGAMEGLGISERTWTNVSNGTSTFQGEHMSKIILKQSTNVEVMARTSLIYDHFIIWPSSVTLTFNLPKQMFQMALLLLKENTSEKLFWNPCIHVEIMARTSSIYDHFIIWPSSVILTFNLPKQMFQMALLLLKQNTYAKLLWNPYINVEVMTRTSSIYDLFIIWPWSVTLTSTDPNKCFKWHYYSSKRTPVQNYFEINA